MGKEEDAIKSLTEFCPPIYRSEDVISVAINPATKKSGEFDIGAELMTLKGLEIFAEIERTKEKVLGIKTAQKATEQGRERFKYINESIQEQQVNSNTRRIQLKTKLTTKAQQSTNVQQTDWTLSEVAEETDIFRTDTFLRIISPSKEITRLMRQHCPQEFIRRFLGTTNQAKVKFNLYGDGQ
ncbi:MAG: hypothetical protein EZS28_013676 [Streblomastix strix]|uniref:Uncharacterized protein n=1 Tax=Streblomastix strix TaxID=222440 RepID=A0A5J4W7W2_9EUKA|nr:MAG: hypothetical protein EZS28_013676 [Streblomastix strix]